MTLKSMRGPILAYPDYILGTYQPVTVEHFPKTWVESCRLRVSGRLDCNGEPPVTQRMGALECGFRHPPNGDWDFTPVRSLLLMCTTVNVTVLIEPELAQKGHGRLLQNFEFFCSLHFLS